MASDSKITAPDGWTLLMQRAQDGDAAAYRQLLNEMTPALKAFLRNRFFSPSHIDDIVQEILLAVHTARHTYRPEQPFRHWMYGIARHKMVDYMRKLGRIGSNEIGNDELVTFFADDTNTPEEALAAGDVQKAMATLPTKQRQVLMLTKIQGYSMAETGQKLGMSETAVKVTAHRALKKLQEWLVAYGY